MDNARKELQVLDEIYVDNVDDVELTERMMIRRMIETRHEGGRMFVWLCKEECPNKEGGKDD